VPNWCGNRIMVVGPEADVREMERLITEADSFLEGLLPQQEEWDYSKWVQIYGTKWTDSGPNVTTSFNGDSSIAQVYTDTAWAPPIEGLVSISEKWPNCTFGMAFSEQGMAIFGFSVVRNGVVDMDTDFNEPDCGDWENDPDGCMDRMMRFEEGITMAMEAGVLAYTHA